MRESAQKSNPGAVRFPGPWEDEHLRHSLSSLEGGLCGDSIGEYYRSYRSYQGGW